MSIYRDAYHAIEQSYTCDARVICKTSMMQSKGKGMTPQDAIAQASMTRRIATDGMQSQMIYALHAYHVVPGSDSLVREKEATIVRLAEDIKLRMSAIRRSAPPFPVIVDVLRGWAGDPKRSRRKTNDQWADRYDVSVRTVRRWVGGSNYSRRSIGPADNRSQWGIIDWAERLYKEAMSFAEANLKQEGLIP